MFKRKQKVTCNHMPMLYKLNIQPTSCIAKTLIFTAQLHEASMQVFIYTLSWSGFLCNVWWQKWNLAFANKRQFDTKNF